MLLRGTGKAILAAVAAVQLGACATVLEGTNQPVAINTGTVADVDCTLNSPAFGSRTAKAPGVVTVEKSRHDIKVHCTKPGYQDGSGVIKSHFAAATVGNVLFGVSGIVIGGVVDAASGAANKYDAQLNIVMTPLPEPPVPDSKAARRALVRLQPQPAPEPVPAAGVAAPAVPDNPATDAAPRAPMCRDVGGYEEYKKRTGEVCRL